MPDDRRHTASAAKLQHGVSRGVAASELDGHTWCQLGPVVDPVHHAGVLERLEAAEAHHRRLGRPGGRAHDG